MKDSKKLGKKRQGVGNASAWGVLTKTTCATAFAALTSVVGRAQEVTGAEGRPVSPEAAAKKAGVRQFDIAEGGLPAALAAFEREAGVEVRSSIPQEDLAVVRTAGVRGEMTEQEALHRLLEATGLSGRFSEPGVVEIGIRDEQQVEVRGTAGVVGLQQFPEPLLDTAQTISLVPQYILKDQADTTLRDGLRTVGGISFAAGEGGSQGDNLTIRGFSARNDIFLDGIRDFGSYYRDAFDYESIDVLEGPAGVEFGRGSTGGVVNQETKQPEMKEHVAANLQLGTNLMRRAAVDVNEPLRGLEGAAFRVNAAGEESDVAGRDDTYVSRFGVAPALALGLNSHTRGFLNYLHEGENDLPDYGLPYFGPGPLRVPRSNYYGYTESDFFRTNPDIVTGRVEHDMGDKLVVRDALRFANYPRDVNITEPQINTVPVFSVVNGEVYGTCSPTAATPCYPVTTPLTALTVRRNQIAVNSVEDMLWDQAGGSGTFRMGRIANDFNVIVEGGRERSRPQKTTYPANIYTSALHPDAQDLIPAATALGLKTYVSSQSYGFGFNDTLKLLRWLQMSGGVRFDYFNTDYVSGSTHLSRLDKQPTYRAAVVAKPTAKGSIYADYGTSFDPSAESLSLSANNAVEPPQYNETYEAGVKWALLGDRLNANASVFETTKTNVYETDPNNTANVIPVGNQRVRGAQMGALGHMPGHFDLVLGYAYLDGRTITTEANYSPFAAYYVAGDPVFGGYPYYLSAKGNPFANVPKNSANLFVTHALALGFVGGFGFNEVSARRASSTGPVAIPLSSAATAVGDLPLEFKVMPGYWTFNAMVRRPLSKRVYFQANVNNLTNAFYIDEPHPGHLIPSEGINAQFGFNYSF